MTDRGTIELRSMLEIQSILHGYPLDSRAQATLLLAFMNTVQFVPSEKRDKALEILSNILKDHPRCNDLSLQALRFMES